LCRMVEIRSCLIVFQVHATMSFGAEATQAWWRPLANHGSI
jgi:hypothetical protein